MVDVSIIMPIYNVEKYLDKSIQSVLNQTHKNIEIILVNDGSKDMSGVICDSYKEQDNRIIVIHQDNAGSGYARNSGLDKASGDYIYFMDPDDYIESTLIEDNIKLARQSDANLVVFGHFYEKTIRYKNVIFKESIPNLENLLTKADFINNFIDFYYFGAYTIWNRLYKHEFLKSNGCRFTNQSVGQDALFNIQVYNSGLDKVIFNKKAYYHYIDREGSAVKRYHTNRFEKQYRIVSELEQLMEKWKLNNKSFDNLIYNEYFNAFYIEFKSLLMDECVLTNNEKKNRIELIIGKPKIQHAISKYYKKKDGRINVKLVILLINQRQYILALNIYRLLISLKILLQRK